MNAAVADLDFLDGADHWRHSERVADAVANAALGSELVFALESPRCGRVAVGTGSLVTVRGICAHRSEAVKQVQLWLDDTVIHTRSGEVRDDIAPALQKAGFVRPGLAGFSGHTLVSAARAKKRTPAVEGAPPHKEQSLRATVTLANDAISTIELGQMQFDTAPACRAVSAPKPSGDGPLVAIVMAAYNPNIDAFRVQIESIQAQTLPSWHLVVCDDGSSPEVLSQIRSVVETDPRITLETNDRNLGFYSNFEAALTRVPAWAQYVALADQDDRWYPRKLEILVDAMPVDGELVYSDMRIVQQDGGVISSTYWRGRRNNHTDLDIVLLANTVTGAASLMRASLLKALLPFPPRVGDAFHDHWIGLSAMVRGPVGYVDEPLYDYIQHDNAVIGHSDFETPSAGERMARVGRSPFRAAFWRGIKQKLVSIRRGALNIHRYECRRLEALARTLILRNPGASTAHLRDLALFDGGFKSGVRLLLKHLSVVRRGASTNDAELRLGMGYIVHAFEPWRQRMASRLRVGG